MVEVAVEMYEEKEEEMHQNCLSPSVKTLWLRHSLPQYQAALDRCEHTLLLDSGKNFPHCFENHFRLNHSYQHVSKSLIFVLRLGLPNSYLQGHCLSTCARHSARQNVKVQQRI